MAGLNAIPGVSQQIRLIGRLRWMLFKNSLRNVKGRFEAVSSAILWLMMSGLVLGGGIFMGIATYYLVTQNQWSWLVGLMWIIFLFWQIYPIFAASVGAQFDFANLLRFPLRLSSFLILSVVYGLFDPGAVSSLFWLLCMWIGLGIARPAMLPWALLVLLAFALMNLFFARTLLAWIEKWLARRRTREILGFIFVVFFICFQFIAPAVQHFEHHRAQLQASWLVTLLSVANVLPPGLAARSLQLGLASNFARAAYLLLSLLIYAAVFFYLLRIRLVAQFHGENLSETSAATAPAARVQKARPLSASRPAAAAWEIPGLSRPVAAMFEKEVRYAMRSGIMLLNFVIPILAILILAFAPRTGGAHNNNDFLRRVPEMIFPLAIAYTILIQTNWVFNCFAFEGTGIQFLLLAPVRFRDIMLAKNLFLGLTSVIEALLVWAVVSLLFVPPPLVIVVASFAGLLYATIANCAIGNILSLYFPRRLEFGVFRQKRQAGATVFIGLVAQAVFIGLGVLVFIGTRLLHRPILIIPIFLGFAIIAAIGYRISLSRVDALAMSRRETLTAELCRQE